MYCHFIHASFELPRFLDLTLDFERVMLIPGRSPAGRGIGHQIMCEELYSFPGTVSVSQTMFPNLLGMLTYDDCLGITRSLPFNIRLYSGVLTGRKSGRFRFALKHVRRFGLPGDPYSQNRRRKHLGYRDHVVADSSHSTNYLYWIIAKWRHGQSIF